MTKMTTRWKYTFATYATVVGIWVVYALLTFFAPDTASSAHFDMHGARRVIIDLTILIPVHLIWLLAAYGVTTFKSYAIMLKGTKEGTGINLIADGLLVTLTYFIVTSIYSSIMPYLIHYQYYDSLAVIRDHLAPLFSLVAFFLLYRGSSLLRQVTPFSTWTTGTIWALVGYAVFVAAFVFDFATTATGGGPTRSSVDILPHEILLVTLILPYVIAWFLGVLACINIVKYASHVKGKLYRKALRDLVLGISGIAIFVIVIQLIGFANRYFSNWSLGPILAILYALIILYGIGFVFVASGAKKLARIEAVQ
jgi:hypothetical protein